MNIKKMLLSGLAALLITCSYAMPVMAQTADPSPPAQESAPTIRQLEGEEAEQYLLQNDEAAAESVADAADEVESASESAPQTEQRGSDSNAPYLAGAVISVLVFGGVIVFCKVKGNK